MPSQSIPKFPIARQTAPAGYLPIYRLTPFNALSKIYERSGFLADALVAWTRDIASLVAGESLASLVGELLLIKVPGCYVLEGARLGLDGLFLLHYWA